MPGKVDRESASEEKQTLISRRVGEWGESESRRVGESESRRGGVALTYKLCRYVSL